MDGYLDPVILAELEAYHSRSIAPTRRIALGDLDLPCDPAPGFGGILLGGILGRFARELDEDTLLDAERLLVDVEHGRRIPQPRVRHRFQQDRIGLRPCRHRLVGYGDAVAFEFDAERGTPAQHVLGAVYAARTVPLSSLPAVVSTLRKGFRWRGEAGPSLVAHLAGGGADLPANAAADPLGWALQVLHLIEANDATGARPGAAVPSRRLVQQAFRDRLRCAHPDHGADRDGAAQRIAELAEARRILLG